MESNSATPIPERLAQKGLRLNTKEMKMLMLAAFSGFLYAANSAPVKGGTFRYHLPINPETLNPMTSHDNYSTYIMRLMAESLLVRDEETYEWVPLLAEKYEISADKRTYTFTLRKGVTFHDGSPFTAEDVAYTMNGFKNHTFPGAYNESMENVAKIEVLDPYKIRVEIKTPKFNGIDMATIAIVPKKVYGDPQKLASLSQTVTGTGPYRLKEYQTGARLILEKNPKWWGQRVPYFKDRFNFDEILVRVSTSDSDKLEYLEKGLLDFAGISLSSYLQKTGGPKWGKEIFTGRAQTQGVFTTQNSLFLNLRRPLFKDFKVRRALQLLLNREMMNQKFNGGLALLATGPWHRKSEYADPDVAPVPFDPKKASQLLREAGWRDTDDDGILDKVIEGKKVDFKFTVIHSAADWGKFMTIYQTDLKKAGIALDIQRPDWSLFMKLLDERNFDSYIVGRGFPGVVDFNPRPEWHSSFTGLNDANAIGFVNAKADKALDKAEVEYNRKKRIKLLREVYRIAAKEQSQIFLFSGEYELFARSARLKMPDKFPRYNYSPNTWWIEEAPLK